VVLAEGGDKYEEPPGRLLQSSAARTWSGLFAEFDRMQARAPTLSCSPLRKSQWCFRVQVSCDGELRVRRSRLTPGRA